MIQQRNNPSHRDLPTTSLYLQDSLQGAGLAIDWDAARSGPFSFRFGDRLVLIRYATEAEIDLAREIRAGGGRVFYVIDDDLEAIAEDSNLPADYRGRISEFVSGPWQKLKELIDEVVVSSPALSEKMRSEGFEAVTRLDPFWPVPAEMIPCVADSKAPLEMAWLCSRSHVADFDSIAGDLTKFLSRHKNVKLTVMFGKYQPAWLKKTPRVENFKPLSWPDYWQWIHSRRFDLALYPLLNTCVNRSRSINKFLEHAVVGAASLISANAPFADRLANGDCVFAEAEEWSDCLEVLIEDRNQLCEFANQGRKRAREISENARDRQIEFWKERLPALEFRNQPDPNRT